LEDTIKAIAVRRKLTTEIETRINNIFNTTPKGKIDFPSGV
jgi:hypothetical protein